jgi:hypothetical protein
MPSCVYRISDRFDVVAGRASLLGNAERWLEATLYSIHDHVGPTDETEYGGRCDCRVARREFTEIIARYTAPPQIDRIEHTCSCSRVPYGHGHMTTGFVHVTNSRPERFDFSSFVTTDQLPTRGDGIGSGSISPLYASRFSSATARSRGNRLTSML